MRAAGDLLYALFGLQARAGRAGREAMAAWPAPIQDLADRLYAAGVPVHVLLIFCCWLFEKLTSSSCLAAAVTIPQFIRLARASLAS